MAKKATVCRICCVLVIIYVCYLLASLTDTNSSLQEPRPFQRDVNDVIETRYFTLSKTVINPVADKYIISGEHICDGTKADLVLVLIPSLPKDIGVRDVLRRTWINALKNNTWPHEKMDHRFEVVFLFGSGYTKEENDLLKTESNVFGDIVQGNFTDNNQNLTRKILFGLKWGTTYCPHVRYLMKIDIDTFVHVPKLLRKVRDYDDSAGGKILCRIIENSAPVRQGIDNVDRNIYPIQFYPPYCAGSVYIISGKAIEKIVHASERMPYLPLENVFVTGIIAKMANVNRINILPNVEFRNTPEWECSFQSSIENDPVYLADSGYGHSQIRRIWKCLNEGPDLKNYIRLVDSDYLTRYMNIYSLFKITTFVVVIVIVGKCIISSKRSKSDETGYMLS